MSERILVIGGLGFVGANLIRYLLETRPDAEVWALDALAPSANPDNVRDVELEPRYRFWRGSVELADHLRALCQRGVTTVVNCAHRTGFDGSPRAMIQTNVEGVRVLCEAAAEAGVGRVVLVSTTAVYGDGSAGLDDDAPPNPRDPYAAGRAAGDLLGLAYHRSFGVPVCVARLPEVFGPFGPPPGLVAAVTMHVLAGRQLFRPLGEPAPREWLYVRDAVAALGRVARAGEPGRAYNVVAGELKTEIEVATLVAAAAGGDPDLVEFGRAAPVTRWSGYPRPGGRAARVEPLAVRGTGVRALGWEPQWSLADAIAETVAWYRANEAWWRRVDAGEHVALHRRLLRLPVPEPEPAPRPVLTGRGGPPRSPRPPARPR